MFNLWPLFNSTQSLRTHIQGQHMDASHLKCSKCDYSAVHSYTLRLHSRIHDPEGKKFKCDFAGCGRVYNTKGHLNEHQGIHTQGRSPPCPHCGKEFSGTYGLNHTFSVVHPLLEVYQRSSFSVKCVTKHTTGELS